MWQKPSVPHYCCHLLCVIFSYISSFCIFLLFFLPLAFILSSSPSLPFFACTNLSCRFNVPSRTILSAKPERSISYPPRSPDLFLSDQWNALWKFVETFLRLHRTVVSGEPSTYPALHIIEYWVTSEMPFENSTGTLDCPISVYWFHT